MIFENFIAAIIKTTCSLFFQLRHYEFQYFKTMVNKPKKSEKYSKKVCHYGFPIFFFFIVAMVSSHHNKSISIKNNKNKQYQLEL